MNKLLKTNQNLFLFLLLNVFIISSLNIYSLGDTINSCRVRLPEIINSYQPTIIPVLTIDGKQLFFDRKVHPDNIGGVNDVDDIWYSKKIDNAWSFPVNIKTPINTKGSDVLFSISPDRSRVLLYGIYSEDSSAKSPGFSIASLIGDSLTQPIPLELKNYYNTSRNFYANLSPDGRILILALERAEGFGDLDLYITYWSNETRSWSDLQNLGNNINTEGIDGSPFLSYDGKTLYFSSNGRKGFGKLDLYMSRRLDDTWKKWSEPVNLDSGINSEYDDKCIWLSALGDTAYIVSKDTSSREGIYSVCLPKKFKPSEYAVLTGNIFNLDNGIKKVINKRLEFEISNNINKGTQNSYFTNITGDYFVVLPANTVNTIKFKSKNNKPIEFEIDTRNIRFPKFITKDIDLNYSTVKEVEITSPKITNEIKTDKKLIWIGYFPLNGSIPDIDSLKLYEKFFKSIQNLKKNKYLIIGHTDESGTEKYNLQLSIKRAEWCKNLLNIIGVSDENIQVDGKGKTLLISKENQLNRRVEVFIVQ